MGSCMPSSVAVPVQSLSSPEAFVITAWDWKLPVIWLPVPFSLNTKPPVRPATMHRHTSIALYEATPVGVKE